MCVQLHMLCKLHSVYNTLHTLCDITQKVSNHYTVEGQFFAFNLEKNYTRQKKFIQTPSVVSVTNMRYAVNYSLIFLNHGTQQIKFKYKILGLCSIEILKYLITHFIQQRFIFLFFVCTKKKQCAFWFILFRCWSWNTFMSLVWSLIKFYITPKQEIYKR